MKDEFAFLNKTFRCMNEAAQAVHTAINIYNKSGLICHVEIWRPTSLIKPTAIFKKLWKNKIYGKAKPYHCKLCKL